MMTGEEKITAVRDVYEKYKSVELSYLTTSQIREIDDFLDAVESLIMESK